MRHERHGLRHERHGFRHGVRRGMQHIVVGVISGYMRGSTATSSCSSICYELVIMDIAEENGLVCPPPKLSLFATRKKLERYIAFLVRPIVVPIYADDEYDHDFVD